jgi:anti-sigma regulatory factor (Ser/Thr protein kinase)
MTLETTVDAPATLDGLARLLTSFRTFLTTARVPATTQRSLHAAIDELLANVVMHGRADDTVHAMAAKITCDDDEIVVELVDNGHAFDPIAYDATDPHELRVGGVGIRLARHWVDEMRYERKGPHNHVVLVKRR